MSEKKKGYGYEPCPTFSYSPHIGDKVIEAYNNRNWRELNYLGVVWYDEPGQQWQKFGSHFWDMVDEPNQQLPTNQERLF